MNSCRGTFKCCAFFSSDSLISLATHFRYSALPTTVQNQAPPPPPPYQQPSQNYSINSGMAPTPNYGIQQNQCRLHPRQQCNCAQNSSEVSILKISSTSGQLITKISHFSFSSKVHHHRVCHRHFLGMTYPKTSRQP